MSASKLGTRCHRGEHLVGTAGHHLAAEPRPPAGEVDHPDLAQRRRQLALVTELLGELDGAAVGLLGRIEVDLDRGAAERLAQRAPEGGLAELHRRPELRPGIPALAGSGPDPPGQLRGGLLVMAHPERRCPPQLDVELDLRVTHRLGERSELGQAIQPLAGLSEDGVRVVASREEDPPVGRRRHDRERLLDEPERLLGGIGGQGGARGIDREPGGPGSIAGGERVLGQHRQAGRGGITALEQQVDDGGVDLAATRRRQLARGELANLLVRERVVRGLALRLRKQEPRQDGRRELVRQGVGAIAGARPVGGIEGSGRLAVGAAGEDAGSATSEARLDRSQVPQAEAAAEDGGVPQDPPGPGGQPRRPAIDQRPDRGRDEPRRVAAEPPHAIDLLERAGLAVGPRQLLDDERHALGLRVHRGRRCGLDRTAQHPLEQLRRLDRGEPSEPQPPKEAHPLHVGHEVHGLGDGRELVRPDRHEQEDGPIGIAADHVAEQPERVVVGPLDVVDEQRERPDGGERRDRNAREIEGPEELGVRRECLVAALVPPGDGLDHPPDGALRRRPGGRVPDRARREQAPREEERAPDLLVGRDRDAGEAPSGGELGGRKQEPCLADARLALHGHRGEAAAGLGQLLGDRLELGAPADDGAGGTAQLDRERALGADQRVEGTAVRLPERCARLDGRRCAARPCGREHHAPLAAASWSA